MGTAHRDHRPRGEVAGRSTRSSSTSCRGGSASVRPPSENELSATRVVALPLDEASAKLRTGPAARTTRGLRARRSWAGELPLRLEAAGAASPTRASPPGSALPAHVSGWRRGGRRGASVLAALLRRAAGRASRPGPSPKSGCCSTAASRRCAASSRTGRPRRPTCCWCATWPRPPASRAWRSSRGRPSSRARAARSVLDLTALGDYEQIDRFFQRLAVSHRLVDVESLTLTATGEDQIQLAAVLRFPLLAGARRRCRRRPSRRRGRPAGVPAADPRRVPARPVAGVRQVGRDRRAAARTAQPAPLPLGARRRSCASGRWCWATPRSARSSRSAAWRSARGRCARSRAASSAASCACRSS